MTNNNDTKNRILETACRLFATSGFNGASIRDIANEAGVNLSAVNYHFGNKDGLLAEILIKANNLFNDEANELESENLDPLELSMRIFAIFRSHAHECRNSFMIFLSENSAIFIAKIFQNELENAGKPPGYQALLNALKREIPSIGPLSSSWAANTILSHLVHSSLFFEMKASVTPPCPNSNKPLDPEKVKGYMLLEIEEMVISVLERAKTDHEKIEANLLTYMEN